jgi:hypothetical protein
MALEVGKLRKERQERRIKLSFGKLRFENCAECESY